MPSTYSLCRPPLVAKAFNRRSANPPLSLDEGGRVLPRREDIVVGHPSGEGFSFVGPVRSGPHAAERIRHHQRTNAPAASERRPQPTYEPGFGATPTSDLYFVDQKLLYSPRPLPHAQILQKEDGVGGLQQLGEFVHSVAALRER